MNDSLPSFPMPDPLPRLTREQAAILTAYTGIRVGSMDDFHKYAQQKLGRPVWLHEFGSPELTDQLKEATKDDLLDIVYKGGDGQ